VPWPAQFHKSLVVSDAGKSEITGAYDGNGADLCRESVGITVFIIYCHIGSDLAEQ